MRFVIWALLWIIGGFLAFGWEYWRSKVAHANGDLSAFAWMGFLPFIFPIFLIYSAYAVVPLAVVTEIVIWIRRIWFSNG